MRLEKISKSEGSRNASTLTLLSELFIFAEGGEGDRVGQQDPEFVRTWVIVLVLRSTSTNTRK